MSKVLKVVGLVASVAAAAVTLGASLGISAGLLGAISIGTSIGSSLLARKSAKRTSQEALSQANYDRLRANIDPRTPRKTGIGETALATDIRDEEFTDNQTFFHRFIVCASHTVQSIDEIWFDDELAWSASSGIVSKYDGYLGVETYTEGSAANAKNISARMGSSRRYTGLAWVYLRYKLTGNSSKVESPFAQSITTRITIRGKGAKLYDPRKDSTVAGGSGSHRANDQGTWTWDDNGSRNPALAMLFYLLGWHINGELAVGKGIPPARIDLESFAIAANICDESVTALGGGTEPRYRCDGLWTEGDQPTSVLDMLKSTMNADLDDVDGKLRLTIFHNDLATPDAEFTADDVLDDFDWDAAAELSGSFNIVRGLYTDASNNSLYQMVDYPAVGEDSPDGIDRIDPFDLPLVQSAGQAQRLAQLRFMRQKFGGIFSAVFQATAWKVQKNSVVRLTFPPRGFVNKLFRVAEMEIRVDGTVPLVLREEDASIYGPPSLTTPSTPVASTPYDYALSPLVQQFNTIASLEIVSLRTYAADYTGTVTPGLLPDVLTPQVTQGGANIRTDDTVSYSIATSGVTASIDNTNGSSNKGRITVSAVSAANAWIDVTATYLGVAMPTKRITILKGVGLPSGFGGSGSKIASDNGFTSINGTSFVPITDVMTVTVSTGEYLSGTAPLDYALSATSSPGFRVVTAKWQYSPVRAGTWTDFGTAIAGDITEEDSDGNVTYGNGIFTHAVNPGAAGDYDIRLVARLNATGRTVFFVGMATIESRV